MARGWLRIYLGAAPGVGKTYAMLNEGLRRRSRGTDVVVGLVETHGRAQTAAQIADLEVIPRRPVAYRGQMLDEMDLAGDPRTAPGRGADRRGGAYQHPGRRARQALRGRRGDPGGRDQRDLDAQPAASGIGLSDVVETIIGVPQRETVPDEFVRGAEQIELIDMTPEALQAAPGARQRLPGRADRRGPDALLPAGQPRRAARAVAALAGRPGRRRAAGLPRAPPHRPPPGRPRSGWSWRSPAPPRPRA